MQAALDQLKADLGIEESEEASIECEQCVASVYVIPTKSAGLNESVNWAHEFESPRSRQIKIAGPCGPPLGSRAPPFSL